MTRFESWRRQRVAGGVLLTSPGGPAAGRVRIRTNKPARPIRHYIPDGDVEIRRLTTEAGELSAIATLRDRNVLCLVGVVRGGTFVVFQGICERARAHGRFACEFEDLVASCATGDDPLRRRMYVYRPPRGWQGARRTFSSCWYPPGCPRDRAFFEVFDALPNVDVAAKLTHELMTAPGRDRRIASCADDSFTYELHYVDPDGNNQHTDEFDRLVSSVEYLPGLGGALVVAPKGEVFAWAM